MSRTRTITWEDPVEALEAAEGLSGLEYLKAIADGRVPPPPIAALMDLGPVEVEEGRALFSAMPAEYHYNPIGLVHGGLAMTLLDSAMGCAVQTILPVGAGYTTLEIKVNFARPITRDTGRVLCEGKIVHHRSHRGDGRGTGVRRRHRKAPRARNNHVPDLLRKRLVLN